MQNFSFCSQTFTAIQYWEGDPGWQTRGKIGIVQSSCHEVPALWSLKGLWDSKWKLHWASLVLTHVVPSLSALFPCLIFPYFLPHNYTLAALNPWISPWNSLVPGILFRFSTANMPSSRPSVLEQVSAETSAPPESSLYSPQTELSITSLCSNNIPVHYLLDYHKLLRSLLSQIMYLCPGLSLFVLC